MPKPDELLFALKTFAGAMVAMYFSLWLGLENPYWSMATAFIVAQPFAGATRSKALYRFCGTLLGGTAAVALVPNLVNAPVLLSLALALWIGMCLYLALLDRSPRSYTFMLAGYTAGIIGFPAVTAPAHIFNTALTRVEEISIGIACTTMVATIFFPRPIAPVLARRITSWVSPAREWAVAALAGEEESAPAVAARRRLAFEATDAAMMISLLGHDTSHMQSSVRFVTRLRLYVISLMPVLTSIGDRVAQLKRLGGITPELNTLLADVTAWMHQGSPEEPNALLGQISAIEHKVYDWAGLLRASLCVRLEELVRIAHHSRVIRRHVLEGDKAPDNPVIEAEYVAVMAETHDHKLALLSALSAAAALLVLCLFWIETGWPAGAGAAVIATVGCSFFAAQDDPAPAIVQMLRNSIIVIIGVAIYNFIILPRVYSFTELVLVLAPAGIIIGVLVARPATFGTGMLLGAFGSSQLALENV
ncbi:MAG TPA: FUSC family protein, partial [Acidocella sp.]|nr:FUSC family protein [Acidocella sp.]